MGTGDLERAQELLATARVPVSFSGAGLSAESGIATFRDPDGVWNQVDPRVYATPQGIDEHPEEVLSWYAQRRRALASAEPNPAHRALADSDLIHITQNVDGLLERAGAETVIRLHGTLLRDRCHAGCGYEEAVSLDEPPGPRRCPRCGAWLRPAVVLFGELLPEALWQRAVIAARSADVMLVVGTSAEVWPAAGLIETAKDQGARIVVVNLEPSAASRLADVELLGPAAELVPQVLATRRPQRRGGPSSSRPR